MFWNLFNIFLKKRFKNIITFEPNPKSFEKLKKNFKLNNVKCDNLYNLGISNSKKKLHFENNATNVGSSKIISKNESQLNDSIMINVDTLDNLLKNIDSSKISFIKIDVEGQELEVIEGALNIVKNVKKNTSIAIEIWKESKSFKKINQIFKENNFILRDYFGDNYLYIKK